ncbi:glycogen/starch/alpha-glucan phosphorylase [Zunongwangia sp. F260]|uniref:Alpha-1,4 glucan phosphorylase n=1 Tax=Autumnicola lenta TaxID=3075593 RepID=A0ABU3CPS4_9FLAO|nr:glycogen/starch/alpha-glucan phosphorylase [Zunongwangia sp. F260]MDT0647935.1 glycogen/starch/alpha-glucan phosphorylase [Zunongwangia sp. F260]
MNSHNKKTEHYFTKPGVANIGLTKEDIKTSFLEKLFYSLGRIPVVATKNDFYTSLALTVRDRVFRKYVKSLEQYAEEDARGVAYLSAEYLPGPHLGNNLLNLEIVEETREALAEFNLDLDELLKEEVEPGLGNGGLGRLASCYMDSLATLGIPSIAYGIRYEFGIFKQEIQDGWQVESTDKWLQKGNTWEIVRPEISFEVKFGGHTEHSRDGNYKLHIEWIPDSEIKGTAYDTPILGYQSNSITLRLWKAEATESFDFAAYNLGEYYRAVEKKMRSENITKVLYPNDENLSGKELRLKQQYFFVCCSLQDIIRLHLLQGRKLETLHEKFTIQLNDTHPSIAVAELMRLLLDVHQMGWEEAWKVTKSTFAYTNHTLLPEALEKWPVNLLRNLLPRHLELIYEINSRFITEIREHDFTGEQISRMSLIDDRGEPTIRMAHLATVGSYKVNGVSALHSGLLKEEVLKDFAQLWPEKFTNVTNGITHRRFLAVSNPRLAGLISEKIGKEWLTNLDKLKGLESFANDEYFRRKWMEVKLENKKNLAAQIKELTGIEINPEMLIDVQVKRIHEYKRQHLKVLHILSLYMQIKKDGQKDIPPTAFIFAGKAAPGYFMAKRIIKLITAVGDFINNDPEVNETLKVIFLPNFSVKLAQHVYPGADLSEQISMAGKEASGTGNMKFALNGALTVGTLDGANVEIREEVGEENFFLFGLTTEEVAERKKAGYHPYKIYSENEKLKRVVDFLLSEELTKGNTELFRSIYDNLLNQDPYLLLQDYQSYVDQMENVYEIWQDSQKWAQMSIINVANMGKFSSDRSIKDYCEKIWKVKAVKA